MPIYDFECPECLRTADLLLSVSDRNKPVQCSCGALMQRIMVHKTAVVGSRDNFGIGREFYDPKTGKHIDNWKSWEKAGFKEPGDVSGKNSSIIKDKVNEMKKRKSYPKKSKALDYAERI